MHSVNIAESQIQGLVAIFTFSSFSKKFGELLASMPAMKNRLHRYYYQVVVFASFLHLPASLLNEIPDITDEYEYHDEQMSE